MTSHTNINISFNMSPIDRLFQLVSQLQHSPSPFPPQRPLPLSPARGASPTASPARRQGSKASPGLLVMMPPAVGPKPVGKVSAVLPLRALRWATAQPLLLILLCFLCSQDEKNDAPNVQDLQILRPKSLNILSSVFLRYCLKT